MEFILSSVAEPEAMILVAVITEPCVQILLTYEPGRHCLLLNVVINNLSDKMLEREPAS